MQSNQPLQALLGIEIPIIQAPMAGVQGWELAVAVAEAGGLGSVPCGMLNVSQVEAQIQAFKQHSDKPYNLNFFCHDMPPIDAEKMAVWQDKLTPFYQALDIDSAPATGAVRMPFDSAMADMLEACAPPVISFHFGLPASALLERVKSWGTVVLSSATTVEEGLWLERNGADVVIAQGFEAGGHRGMFLTGDIATQVGTLPLVAQLVDRLNIPVVAAGGISSAKAVQAMMQLGASGVQIGTSYLLCNECKLGPAHRNALEDLDAPTALTNVFSGRPARGIRNKAMIELGDISEAAPDFPYASIALGPLRQEAEAAGSVDFTPLWSGQDRSGCKAISAREMTRALWSL